MTILEAIQRGNNLLITSLVAIAGFVFSPEIFIEDKLQYKLDDVILFLLGIGTIAWYKRGNNRFTRSIVPVILVITAMLVKIVAIFFEFKEKDDVGDDFGGLILFVLSTALAVL